MATDNLVLYEKYGSVRVICFNSPPLNISTPAFSRALDDAISLAENDDEASVVVFCANGKVFSAGADMKDVLQHVQNGTYASVKMAAEQDIRQRIEDLSIPTIAALDADAFGGGLETALACDMRIAKKGVAFHMPEVDMGSFAGAGGTPRLVRLIGPSRTLEYLLFGEKLSAEKALEWGLVNAIATDTTARELAMDWANKLAEKPRTGLQFTKRAVIEMLQLDQCALYQSSQRISADVAKSRIFMDSINDFFDRKTKKKT